MQKKRCHGAPLSNNVIASPEGARQSRPDLLQFLQRSLVFGNNVYFRFAKVPNVGLGHIHASMAATLALRICTSCNTLRLGYTKKFSCIARLAGVCPVEKLLQVLKGCFILGNNFFLRSELGAFGGVTVAN